MNTPDRYDTWRKLLAGEKTTLVNDEPAAGFYRVRKGDTWLPVAYWYKDDGALRCRVGHIEIDDATARERWSFACKHPITHEVYTAVINGAPWPDQNEAVIGHNRAPVDDSIEAITERIADLAREAEKMIAAGAATDQAHADQASDLANSFGELEKKSDKLREDEKAPHLAASREVDGKWRPVIAKAADLKARLKRAVLTPFLQKQDAERYRVQAAAIAKGTAPDSVPEVRTTAGSSKRTTALRQSKRAEITDYAALYAHLKDHPQVKEAVEHIANASARAGIELPGMKIITEKVAA